MRALLIIVALTTSAHADFGGGGWMHYEASYLRTRDRDQAPTRDLTLAGGRVGGFFGKRVAWAATWDFAFGSTIGNAGFLYESSLMPIGIALRPTNRTLLALTTGVAISGAIGTLDDAVAWPLELIAEASIGPARILARARASWISAASARQDGSPTLTWTDELDATLALRIGDRFDQWRMASGSGYFLGITYRELYGAAYAGIVLGFSIDAGTALGRGRPE